MLRYVLSLIAAFFLLSGVANAQEAKKLYVVTTTAQISDVVKNIAGGNLRVEHLMGTGVDPHLYRPARSDIVKLKDADIVFYNGLHLEGQMIELFETLKTEKTVIGLAEHLPQKILLTDETNKHDPHVWMNARAWVYAAEKIRDTLVKADQVNKMAYAKNAENYIEKLKSLDTYINASIKTIPQEKRILVTAHDAFGYFGAAYGIEVIGIQGLSTESEAGLQRMEELSSLLAEKKIPAIFSESSVSERNIRALTDGAKSKGHSVKIGGTLYSDAMGAEGTPEGTYLGMMKHNTRAIVTALGGKIDE